MFEVLKQNYEAAVRDLIACLDDISDGVTEIDCEQFEKKVTFLEHKILHYVPQNEDESQQITKFFLSELRPQIRGDRRYQRLCALMNRGLRAERDGALTPHASTTTIIIRLREQLADTFDDSIPQEITNLLDELERVTREYVPE